jgi:hypothetical protein
LSRNAVLLGLTIARRLRRVMLITSLRQQQREAQSLGKSLESPAHTSSSLDDSRPIE